MATLSETFTSIANAIRAKLGGSSTYTPAQMPAAISSIPAAKPEQTKSVSPSTSAQTVTPDTGKVLSSVTVSAIQTQTKSASPSTSAQTITPDSGKYLTSVSISAVQTQTKSATPSTSAQTISPDTGKYLSSVSISAILTEVITGITPTTSAQTITPSVVGAYLRSVGINAIPTETKSVTATASSQTVTPTSGKYLTQVTVNPQNHTATYTPSANTSANNMGDNHNYKYVNTSGMIIPSGTYNYSTQLTTQGTHYIYNIDAYKNVAVTVAPALYSYELWSNSSPSSTFEGQTVTLNETMGNYKYIAIKFRVTTSTNLTRTIIVDRAEFSNMTGDSDMRAAIVGYNSSGSKFIRHALYKATTQVQFVDAKKIEDNSTNNNACIPVAFYGLKFN